MRLIYPPGDIPSDADLAALYTFGDPDPDTNRWTRANMVSSADGASTLSGRSGGLSSTSDQAVFALQRALADVILVGAGTARAEGYQPVRLHEGARWRSLREGRPATTPIAVVTSALGLDLASPLISDAPEDARTLLITTAAAPAARRKQAAKTAEVIVAGEARVDPRAAVTELAGRGYPRILLEGGPLLLSQFVSGGLLDDLCLTIAPLLAGPGADRIVANPSRPMAPPEGIPRRFHLAHVLEDNGFLLCRYTRASYRPKAAAAPAATRAG